MSFELEGPFAKLTDSTGVAREKKSMLIRDSTWEKIREQFSEDEKVALRQAISGQAICPRGVFIDPDMLDGSLRPKLTAAVKRAGKGGVKG